MVVPLAMKPNTPYNINRGLPPCQPDSPEHDFSASKTVAMDAFGVKTKRVFYCTFCGIERPKKRDRPHAEDGPATFLDEVNARCNGAF